MIRAPKASIQVLISAPPRGRARPKGSSGTARAARSLLRRKLDGAKRIEAVLKPEAAAALAALRERTGRTYSAIIEGLLLAEQARHVRRAG
jgi:predicted component of type VI protein secretion system